MSAHTQGPWMWSTNPDDHEDEPWLKNADGVQVCWFGNSTHYYPTQGNPPNDADMALIAAAPDLLAACEGLLDVLALPYEKQVERVEAAERAIAKARGQ